MSRFNLVGILQGRLTPSTNGQLQCFPSENWENEFFLVPKCGLQAIELLFEKEKNPANPLWSVEGLNRIAELSRKFKITVSAICADYFMNHPLTTSSQKEFKEVSEVFRQLIGQAAKLQAPVIVIPFFEDAEIHNKKEVSQLTRNLEILQPFIRESRVRIALETTLRGPEVIKLVDGLGNFEFGVCYDTGNTTALGHDVPCDIKLLNQRIIHVHIKDRTRNGGQNVLLGTGDTNFKEAFEAFRDIHYTGPFILETVRGDDPLQTAITHSQFIKRNFSDKA